MFAFSLRIALLLTENNFGEKMQENDFDLEKPWRLPDLPTSLRDKILGQYDLDSEEWYIDFGGCVEEVPSCPFCDQGTWEDTRCKHVVFQYYDSDIGDVGYMDVAPQFQKYVQDVWIPKAISTDAQSDPELHDVLLDLPEGSLPHPRFLDEYLPDFEYREAWFYWGGDHAAGHGRGYGYANESFLGFLRNVSFR
jgi:hypothetical protein